MTRSTGGRRAVITGLGAITPVGNDVGSTWEALLAGKSGGAHITRFETTDEFPTRIACEVKDFDPSHLLAPKEARRFDRFAQFGISAADEAVKWAGLDVEAAGIQPERFGVIFGSGIGGITLRSP